LNPPTPHRSTSPPASKAKRSTIPEDPGTRLRAISAELRARKPRGLHAVELLVEADEYVKPGTLEQYGEAMGCDPGDIAAAKRVVVGRGRR
jgi:hypothetical protein